MASLNPLSGSLGRRRAAHLLRRASFRYARTQVDDLSTQTATQAVTTLLTTSPLQHAQPYYATSPTATPVTWINPPKPPDAPLPAQDFEMRPNVLSWWTNEALHDPGITHKMTFFLHQFLATDADAGTSSNFFDYLSLLRWGSLGNFKKLLVKIVTDNSMLYYLDNDQNFAQNPNENFAREFFELFTIGRGQPAGPGDYTTFTEDDIVQAARVFTGFNHALRNQNTDPDTNIPAGKGYPQTHDFGQKTFSPRFADTVIKAPANDLTGMIAELQAFVDMVFAQDETAKNICRRLYHYFVTRKITQEVEDEVITPLAATFRTNDFELKPVLLQLLTSEHFYDADDTLSNDEIVGALIKSPLDLALQALSFFDLPIPDAVGEYDKHYNTFYNSAVRYRMLELAGMPLFYPWDVAGYPGYYQDPDFNRQFFNSATIISRYKLPQMLLTGTFAWGGQAAESIGTKLDIAAWVKDSGTISDPSDSYVVVEELVQYLFPEEPDGDRLNHFLEIVFLDGIPPFDWTIDWNEYVSSGDDMAVKIPLQRLVNALLYAPEYQVF